MSQVSSLRSQKLSKNLKTFRKSENFPQIRKLSKNHYFFMKKKNCANNSLQRKINIIFVWQNVCPNLRWGGSGRLGQNSNFCVFWPPSSLFWNDKVGHIFEEQFKTIINSCKVPIFWVVWVGSMDSSPSWNLATFGNQVGCLI